MSTFIYMLIWVIGVLLILVYRGYRNYNDKYFFLGSGVFEVYAILWWPATIPGFFILNVLIKILMWSGNKIDYLGRLIAYKLDKDPGSIED